MAGDDDRLVKLLGAFGLAVADRVRADTEAAVGHSGAAAAALVMIAQFPGRTVEFLRRAVGLSHPGAPAAPPAPRPAPSPRPPRPPGPSSIASSTSFLCVVSSSVPAPRSRSPS